METIAWGKSKHRIIYIYIYTHTHTHTLLKRVPGGTSGKESTYQCRRPRFHPWVGKSP